MHAVVDRLGEGGVPRRVCVERQQVGVGGANPWVARDPSKETKRPSSGRVMRVAGPRWPQRTEEGRAPSGGSLLEGGERPRRNGLRRLLHTGLGVN